MADPEAPRNYAPGEPAEDTRTLPRRGGDPTPVAVGATPVASTFTATPPAVPPAPAGDPPLPTLPGYQVLKPLGRGGMGLVYLAFHQNLGRLVALKTTVSSGPRDLERFWAESRFVSRVNHPHVLRVYDFGSHDGRWFLATEYCPGGTLRDRLNSDTLMWTRDAVTLAKQIASGVGAAHALGIVHRDLKPGNVFFTEDGTPRVGDFGLALLADGPDDAPGSGTPAYLAPEQVERQLPTPATDVWALGVILYEMLTGGRPFDADTTHGIHMQILTRSPPAPRDVVRTVPRELSAVVMKCLEKDPGWRYRTAVELEADLGRFLEGVPIRAAPSGVGERATGWLRRNPTPVVLIVAVTIGIGAGLLYNAIFGQMSAGGGGRGGGAPTSKR